MVRDRDRDLDLDRYADLVGSGRVLELGSGPGWDALHLEARGVRVTRSDATGAFLTRLRAAGHEALHLGVRTDDLGGPGTDCSPTRSWCI